MKLEIKNNIENKLLGRKEIRALTEADKTPSFAEASKMIAEQLKVPEENIMAEKIAGKFGANTFLIKASIYDTKELKEAAVKRLIKPKKAAPAA